jgi:hypothetical protein
MSTAFVLDMGYDDRDYESLLDIITDASVRLDALQSTLSEVRHLCQSGNISSDQILKVLDRQGVYNSSRCTHQVISVRAARRNHG